MTGAAPLEPTVSRDLRLTWVVGTLLVFGMVVAAIGNEQRVQDWDPQYSKVMVDRVVKYGGTFYQNALHNKGPLDPLVHLIGARIVPESLHWVWIALVAALTSLAVGAAAARTARFGGAPAPLGVAVGVFTFMHFGFSDADYAGVLYPRNITVALLSIVWILLLSEERWTTPRRRMVTTALACALLGLAVQTLQSSVFAAVALLVAGYLLLRDRVPGWERLKLTGVGFLAGDLAFLGAVVWYAVRGGFEEFWSGWFTYARYFAGGTGSSLPEQFGLGWDQFYAFHEQLPVLAAVVAGFFGTLIFAWSGWPRQRRIVFVAVAAWWASGWLELIFTQRYSSHYYSIIAAPIALMIALLLGTFYRRFLQMIPRAQARAWWPVAAAAAAVFAFSPSNFGQALYTTVHFQGGAALEARDDKFETGNGRTSRAVLDMFTTEGDPLLAWTNEPWPYLTLERVSATRFPWKSFLLGEIYLGQTSPSYVLPQTWEWFAEDLAESDPITFIESNWTLQDGNPLAEHVRANFTRVYNGEPTAVWLQNDLAAEVLERRGTAPWEPPGPTPAGWETAPGTATWVTGSEHLPLGGMCFRVEGTIQFTPDAGGIVGLYFTDPTGAGERLNFSIDRGGASSGSDFVRYEETTLGDAGIGRKDFSLIVGGRSALLVMQGEVVAALRLPQPMEITVEARTAVTLSDLLVGPAPAASGCG